MGPRYPVSPEAGDVHGEDQVPSLPESPPGDPTPSSRTGLGKRGKPRTREPVPRLPQPVIREDT